jgi:hypothetical protein
MHPHLEQVFSRLDHSRAQLRAAVDAVAAPARATKPAPDRWSVAEVIEHLSIVERLFGDRIVKAIESRGASLESETVESTGLPDPIEARMADRVNKRMAPEIAHPKGALACDDCWAIVESGHHRLRSALASADGKALSQISLDHPFFGSLTIYQWIELIAAHEARHTEQIKEIAVALAV